MSEYTVWSACLVYMSRQPGQKPGVEGGRPGRKLYLCLLQPNEVEESHSVARKTLDMKSKCFAIL